MAAVLVLCGTQVQSVAPNNQHLAGGLARRGSYGAAGKPAG